MSADRASLKAGNARLIRFAPGVPSENAANAVPGSPCVGRETRKGPHASICSIPRRIADLVRSTASPLRIARARAAAAVRSTAATAQPSVAQGRLAIGAAPVSALSLARAARWPTVLPEGTRVRAAACRAGSAPGAVTGPATCLINVTQIVERCMEVRSQSASSAAMACRARSVDAATPSLLRRWAQVCRKLRSLSASNVMHTTSRQGGHHRPVDLRRQAGYI
jgi:hypothetical protein